MIFLFQNVFFIHNFQRNFLSILLLTPHRVDYLRRVRYDLRLTNIRLD